MSSSNLVRQSVAYSSSTPSYPSFSVRAAVATEAPLVRCIILFPAVKTWYPSVSSYSSAIESFWFSSWLLIRLRRSKKSVSSFVHTGSTWLSKHASKSWKLHAARKPKPWVLFLCLPRRGCTVFWGHLMSTRTLGSISKLGRTGASSISRTPMRKPSTPWCSWIFRLVLTLKWSYVSLLEYFGRSNLQVPTRSDFH